MGILDTIKETKHTDLAKQFEPVLAVARILEKLKERDKTIVTKRFGLSGQDEHTLEEIGKQLQLTRERVRQIEKGLIKQLRQASTEQENVKKGHELLKSTIVDHGGIVAELDLLEHLGIQAIEDANAVRFLLHLLDEVQQVRGETHVKDAWSALTFDHSLLKGFIKEAKQVLTEAGRPHGQEEFLKKFKATGFFKQNAGTLTDKVILNFLRAAKEMESNPFGEYGLSHWQEIKPRDVGDKAYIVLKHHGKPEHYTKITELINQHHKSGRRAFKETTHNELIKDSRFVLVGRGIYALAEWGYKPGVVADVIKEVLEKSGKPLTKDEIVAEVLKRRMVKKNTVLVGLSNRKFFKKVGKNQYDVA